LGIIVSPFVYETVIRPGSDLSEEASYIQVPVELRESSTIAWMRLISPDLATTHTRPGANEPAASQEP